ncbi:MarR family winged helix-turn-helix transcriptional regulator [Polymorphospora sp. NPDC050346]|uniref:MarR family winged helix-turn-helix transcriptional regulator n=1 Tax=Polymorphospora sp. NPDC050346 TaxID=3155780 RepID=UPI0033D36AEC
MDNTPPVSALGAPAGASLAHDLGFNLGVLFRAYVKASNEVVSDIPGGPRGYQVLAAAVHGDAGSQSALAKRLGIDRTVMTYLVDDLEIAELVARRPDPADRRNRQIVATDKGHVAWKLAERHLRAIDTHLLGEVSEDEARVFRDVLRRLAVRANEVDRLDNACELVQDLGSDPAPAPKRRARRGPAERRADAAS